MKKTGKTDIASSSIPSAVLSLAVPMAAAELAHVLYNIVDRIYIGHIPGEGTLALTGVGIAFPLVSVIGAFANLFGYGGAPLASIALGEGDRKKAEKIISTCFTLLTAAGAILTALLFLFAGPVLSVLGSDSSTIGYALDYFRIYVLGSIFSMLALGMNGFITAQGFGTVGMLSVVIGAAANIVLDPVFIFALNMGVRGAAIATVISQIISAAWIMVFLAGPRPQARFRRPGIDPGLALSMMKLGITGFTFRLTNFATNSVANITLKAFGGSLSTLYIGSMSVVSSLREITTIPVQGIDNGGYQPVLGFCYGEKRWDRMDECISYSLKLTFAVNTAVYLVLMLLPGPLCSLFSSDPELVALAASCTRMYFMCQILMPLQFMGQTTYIALNYPGYAVFFSLLRKAVLVIPLTLILPRLGLGADGVFYAEAASQLIGGTCCFTAMSFLIWRPIKKRARGGNAHLPGRPGE